MVTEVPDAAVGLSSINFMDLLSYIYNNYDVALNDNYIFAGPNSAQQAATMADDTFYRTLNGSSLINMIDGTKDFMKLYLKDFTPNQDIAPASSETEIRFFTHHLMNKLFGPGFKHQEVLAYKIEKMPATSSGDSSEQNIIQKFWIFNSPDAPPEISIYDSQVKYGKDYTYKISAYVLSLSHKYKYDDFRLTKQIGAANYLGTDADDGGNEVEYCLQFYNPENNMISPQLFAEADLTLPEDSPLRTVISGMNEFAPNSVEISRHPQLLDFHLYFEPCVELIEVPMFQKTVKVMDSPCNSINVVPFHFIDNNNKLGFQINQESFIKRPYPEIIHSTDLKNKLDYFKTKEIEPYNMVDIISESPARYIEMYRIKKKPNSFADFKDSLVATVDLRIKNEVYNFKNKIISDQVVPNTVYYYIFRFLNENGVPGPLSQIIQSELVNDGGYSYALFDTIDTSEFNPNQVATNSVVLKKLMQIDPNINQLYFNDQEVNYQDFAQNQISNLQVGIADKPIWDKKFKIRLTSKKTSKKLDLNISYNTIERNLSKNTEISTMPDEYERPGIPTSITLDEPPIDVILDSGIGDDSLIPEATEFGVATGYRIDGVGEGVDLDRPPGVEDGLVLRSELHPAYSYLRTEGTGFPITLYRLLSAATHTMTGDTADTRHWFDDTVTGLQYLKLMINTPVVIFGSTYGLGRKWNASTATWAPEVGSSGRFAYEICRFVYMRRNSPALIAPMDKQMAIVSSLYMLNLLPQASFESGYAGYRFEIAKRKWTNNGPEFNRYKHQIMNIFRTHSIFSNDDNYGDFLGSEHCPADFSMGELLENLNLDPTMLL